MKRVNTSLDLLASMTADALFAGRQDQAPAEPPVSKPGSAFRLGRHLEPTRAAVGGAGSPEREVAPDDSWVGGWYAKSRQLQAAARAHLSGRKTANAASRDVEESGAKDVVDVVTQIKDLS